MNNIHNVRRAAFPTVLLLFLAATGPGCANRKAVSEETVPPPAPRAAASATIPAPAAPAPGNQTTTAAPSGDAFTSAANGYQISPPANWQVSTQGVMGAEVAMIAPAVNGFAPNLNVVVTPVPPGETLENTRTQVTTMMSRMLMGYAPVGQGEATVDGSPAFTHTGTHQMGTPPRTLRIYQVFTLRGGKGYSFTCTTPADNYAPYEDACKAAVASVRWTAR